MIDTNRALREFLLAQSQITALVSQEVYWPRLPEQFAGPKKAICFAANGGESNPYVNEQAVSYQIICYGSSSIEARTVYRALWDVLHGIENKWTGTAYMLHALEQNSGQDLIDPDTNWPFVLSMFEVKFRAYV